MLLAVCRAFLQNYDDGKSKLGYRTSIIVVLLSVRRFIIRIDSTTLDKARILLTFKSVQNCHRESKCSVNVKTA